MTKKKTISVQKIIEFLGDDLLNVHGEIKDVFIDNLADVENTNKTTLDWISPVNVNKQQIAELSKAKVVVVGLGVEYTAEMKRQGKVTLIVENPKLTIAKVGNTFFVDKVKPGIHHTAVIHPEAEYGSNVFIGANVSIGKCKIGDNVQIHANAVLYDNVVLYNNVHIHANASIGVAGLGCEREKNGSLVKFPHLGGVIIENDVEIGAACIIARGALSDTIISKGTKINVGCFIAHNTIIGCNAWISPKVNIAGSVKVDDNVTIFSGAIIREQRHIGKGSIIGMGSVITKNIPTGETWVGNPARKLEKK